MNKNQHIIHTTDGEEFVITASSSESVTVNWIGSVINGIEYSLTGWIELRENHPGYQVKDLYIRRTPVFSGDATNAARSKAYGWFREIGTWLASDAAKPLFAQGRLHAAEQDVARAKTILSDAQFELNRSETELVSATIEADEHVGLRTYLGAQTHKSLNKAVV